MPEKYLDANFPFGIAPDGRFDVQSVRGFMTLLRAHGMRAVID
ncbi:MAG: hypothetical protein ABSB30_12455 [Terracidiphilus sp.]|jgi:hypothetical protein